jgi:hypothetical protein
LPPHQLGRFVAFDINHPERLLPERSLPEDPLLASGEYGRFQAAQAMLAEGWRAFKSQDYAKAVTCAQVAESNNPAFYRNAWLLARSFLAQGQTNAAAAACRSALVSKPALATERNDLDELARHLGLAPAQLPSRADRQEPGPAAVGAH